MIKIKNRQNIYKINTENLNYTPYAICMTAFYVRHSIRFKDITPIAYTFIFRITGNKITFFLAYTN